jgi:hypothetical protein
MSKATRKTRAAEARTGTVAADHRIEIVDAPNTSAVVTMRPLHPAKPDARAARLAAGEFASMAVHVVQTRASRRAQVWRTADGEWWRRGGTVRIQKWPEPDGARSFVVFLWKGANEDDLKFMLEQVERARQGIAFDDEWQRVTSDWADDLTFACTLSRSYLDPYTHRDDSLHVHACDDALCIRKWHKTYDRHELDEVRKQIPSKEGSYRIAVGRDVDAPPNGWIVDVYTDEFYGTPDDVAAFVSDLQWMQEECRRANEKAVSA